MFRRVNKIAVIGITYPQAMDYLDPYLHSLENQTNKNFDLVIGNSGLKEIDSFITKYKIKSHVIPVNGTIMQNRKILIDWALSQGYEFVISTDCDDYIALNRVEVCEKLLRKNQIVVNDLDIANERGKVLDQHYLNKRIKNNSKICSNDIINYNIMGLGNTSASTEVMSKIINTIGDTNVIALDWLLWSQALLDGCQAIFTSETSTIYRIHISNTAGLPQKIDSPNVLKGIKVKRDHYRQLSEENERYNNLYLNFNKIHKRSADKSWLNDYIEKLIINKIDYPFWWENIRILK